MSPEDLMQIALEMDPESQAPHSNCFNRPGDPLHERFGGPSVHSPRSVGRTTWIVAQEGYPAYQQWVEAYFASGMEYDQLVKEVGRLPADQQEMYGRSPSYLLRQVQILRSYAQSQPEAQEGCIFTDHMVAEFLVHLVLVQSWKGAQGERRVLEALNARCPTWTNSDIHTDVRVGIDLVHDQSEVGVQVKPAGWTTQHRWVESWLRKSSKWKGSRWVVEYTSTFEIATVFEVALNPAHLWPLRRTLDDLIAAAGCT